MDHGVEPGEAVNPNFYSGVTTVKKRRLAPGDLVHTVSRGEYCYTLWDRPGLNSKQKGRLTTSDVCLVVAVSRAQRSDQQILVISQHAQMGWIYQEYFDRIAKLKTTQ